MVGEFTALTHIEMPLELRDEIKVYAGDNGLGFADAVVQLIVRGMEKEEANEGD